MMTATIAPNLEPGARSSLQRRLGRQAERASVSRPIPPKLDLQPTKVIRKRKAVASGE
jgi:hypothetical protein